MISSLITTPTRITVMIKLLFSLIFSEITLIMVILLFETPLALMEVVIKVLDMFMKTFTRVVFLLLMSIFLLMIVPRLYNIMLIPNIDQNSLFEATLKGNIYLNSLIHFSLKARNIYILNSFDLPT